MMIISPDTFPINHYEMQAKKTAAYTVWQTAEVRAREMEPLKSKELKNQRFDVDEEDAEVDPEVLDENFKGFEESFDNFDDDDEDY